MTETGIGRLLVASLHQGVTDVLPTRVEFYEAWLNPANLRAGRIGLAPLAAVLGFLREEGERYSLVTARAGKYAAEWTFGALSPLKRRLTWAAPPALRMRLVGRIVGDLVRRTCGASRMDLRWRRGTGVVAITSSIFCEVRVLTERPRCEYYAAAIRRLMELFGLDVEVVVDGCRAVEVGPCRMTVVALGPRVERGEAGAQAWGAECAKMCTV